ncbi:MarR family transcriptional regulator [Corallococcus interemptor]|uniref:MarR family transcriptional regulator n=1 Tax=Corallococcus interemptor TaxID=2316720 RepID=A0A3A8Q676_9BACT|nr:MarR family winged helix-turn-helix transcriptional regulator [Corallococcus interemptor]RKH40785.1 MarR family transcriptional regulator [Corallococcus sp. AB050B]RKH58774.1 MarR family transcriptional regulator [Corallococcus interemptor]
MTGKRPGYFEENNEPISARIATGLHKIGLAMKQQSWQQANGVGLSATQGQILATLVASGPLTGKELSERLGVTLPTISDSVRVLVEKAMVTRSADPRHPRASLLTPTAAGAALGARARSWPEFMADAVADLAPEEQRAFFAGIVKMIRMLQEQGLVPVSGMCVTCKHFRPNVRTGPAPHHCAFVDAPLSSEQLRLDCPEHELAAESARREVWEQFMRRA